MFAIRHGVVHRGIPAGNLRPYISDELQMAIENPVAANFASLGDARSQP
jgi:hypothetical protein